MKRKGRWKSGRGEKGKRGERGGKANYYIRVVFRLLLLSLFTCLSVYFALLPIYLWKTNGMEAKREEGIGKERKRKEKEREGTKEGKERETRKGKSPEDKKGEKLRKRREKKEGKKDR